MNGILSLYSSSFTSCSPAWDLHHSTQVSCSLQETCTTRCKSPATCERLAPLDASLLQPARDLHHSTQVSRSRARDLHHSMQVSCNLRETCTTRRKSHAAVRGTCTTRCKSPATCERLAPLDASLPQPARDLHHLTQVSCNLRETCTT